MKVAKFGGSSLADSVQLKKVKEIIEEDSARKYIVVSAPGKGVNNNHKVTDLLAMCHELSAHDLNFNEVYKIIENVFKNIVFTEINFVKFKNHILENGKTNFVDLFCESYFKIN